MKKILLSIIVPLFLYKNNFTINISNKNIKLYINNRYNYKIFISFLENTINNSLKYNPSFLQNLNKITGLNFEFNKREDSVDKTNAIIKELKNKDYIYNPNFITLIKNENKSNLINSLKK